MADAKVALDGIRDAVISKFKVLNFHITTLKSAHYFKNKTYYFLITLIYFRQNITIFTNKLIGEKASALRCYRSQVLRGENLE